jgi:hypothetical protein
MTRARFTHVSTIAFDYSDGTFYADASTLGWKPGEGRVILALESHTTGKVERFILDSTDKAGGLRFKAQSPALLRKGVEVFVTA